MGELERWAEEVTEGAEASKLGCLLKSEDPSSPLLIPRRETMADYSRRDIREFYVEKWVATRRRQAGDADGHLEKCTAEYPLSMERSWRKGSLDGETVLERCGVVAVGHATHGSWSLRQQSTTA